MVAVKNKLSLPTTNDFERVRYNDQECVDAFRELFPQGFAAKDVIAEIAPEGWERSPLVAIFHPSLEQVFQEAVDSHENLQELCRSRGKAFEPPPTLDEVREQKIVEPGSDEEGLFEPIGRVTSLEAPHRVADAILRDSELNGVAFRSSDEGKKIGQATLRNATPLFELCPTALLFGIWDSTGPKGGLGVKFQRAIVSEIHVHLTFADRVIGPVLIGAGRFLGYGLCRPTKQVLKRF